MTETGSIQSLDKCPTGVYVEKCPCYYYGNQLRLRLVYDLTRARYTGLHAVSSLQSPRARGMSLLEKGIKYVHNLFTYMYIVNLS